MKMSTMQTVMATLTIFLILFPTTSSVLSKPWTIKDPRIPISAREQSHVEFQTHFTLYLLRGGGVAATPFKQPFLFKIPLLKPLISLLFPKKSSSLLSLLQEEIVSLQRQVRTYQEEIRQLRYLIQHQSTTRREDTSTSIRKYKIQEELLQKHVEQLQLNMNTLISTQTNLETSYQAL